MVFHIIVHSTPRPSTIMVLTSWVQVFHLSPGKSIQLYRLFSCWGNFLESSTLSLPLYSTSDVDPIPSIAIDTVLSFVWIDLNLISIHSSADEIVCAINNNSIYLSIYLYRVYLSRGGSFAPGKLYLKQIRFVSHSERLGFPYPVILFSSGR